MNEETRAAYEYFKCDTAITDSAKNNKSIESISQLIDAAIRAKLVDLPIIRDFATTMILAACGKIEPLKIAQQMKKDAGTYHADNYDDVHF